MKTHQAMHQTKLPFLAVASLIVSLACAHGQTAAKANAILLRAMSPYEDMVGFALAKNTERMTKALAAADKSAAGVKAVLPASAASQFDSLLQAIHQSATGNNHHQVAASAVDVFRLLIDNLQADGLKEPKEVSLLDWAGFKLHVLATAGRPDWEAMRNTVANAAGWWEAIKAKVTDKGLRDAFNSTIGGLQTASKTENLPMLNFAAQMDLDLVDLLEAYFKRKP
jgi:hypothetical protein